MSSQYKKCPGCNGKGKYVGLRIVEDPCKVCKGEGLVEREGSDTEPDYYFSHDEVLDIYTQSGLFDFED